MDPLAHTLAGAALAEIGLARTTRLATATLIIGANLPDVDAISRFWGEDAERSFRRGWTHGVLAMIVLPLLLAGTMLLIDRWRGGTERARGGVLLALACISVWSHPLLDWLNTYGIRLLMPFDGTWFYGDALFIVDPFLWLALGTAVMLAHSRTPLGIAGWIALGAATTSLVVLSDRPPLATKIAWVVCVGLLAVARARRWGEPRFARWARVGVAIALAYLGAMIAASQVAEEQAQAWLSARGVRAVASMAAPSPGNPFLRTVIAQAEREYRVVEIDWLAGEPREVIDPIARGRHDEIVAAARKAPGIGGFVDRLRFPVYQVDRLADGWRVWMGDARRATRSRALRGVVVRLDADLRAIEVVEEER
jgi:inner membrane protein